MNKLTDQFMVDSNTIENIAAKFCQQCEDRTLVVGILGLGYVGLPLAEAFITAGFRVMGFDIDQSKFDHLAAGRTYIRHIDNQRVQEMMATGRMSGTTDFSRLGEADALLVCVPTPLSKNREPDLQYVVSTTETIGQYLRPGHLVVLESTTYPGTTEEVMIPILEQRSGLRCGVDFAIAYSPEREDPGNLHYSTTSIPKVVGADTDLERQMALAVYGSFTETVPVSNLKTAEAVKLSENIFRLVNISLANELKFIFKEMGIDPWEVVDAAKTKPFGYMPFYPGPGIGGHCIPIDPFYLTWKARSFGASTRFIDLAGDICNSLPRFVVEAIASGLSHNLQKAVSGSRVLIVGIAYKKNIDDLRESAALPIIEQLSRRGATVEYFDPLIPSTGKTGHGPLIDDLVSVELTAEVVASYDCCVILTDHDEVDYDLLLNNATLIVDTRNVTHRYTATHGHKIIKA